MLDASSESLTRGLVCLLVVHEGCVHVCALGQDVVNANSQNAIAGAISCAVVFVLQRTVEALANSLSVKGAETPN